MSDSIANFQAWKTTSQLISTTEPSLANGWTQIGSDLPGTATSTTDTTAPPVWYGLRGHTANGVVIPYTGQSLNTVASGSVLLQTAYGAVSGTGSTSTFLHRAIVCDHAGNVIVCGVLGNVVKCGNGQANLTSYGVDDFIVAKYTRDGVCLWSHSYGNILTDQATGVAVNAANEVFVIGMVTGGGGATTDYGTGPVPSYGRSDIIVFKFNPDGTIPATWPRTTGGDGTEAGSSVEQGTRIAVDSTGNIYLYGRHAFFGTGLDLAQFGGPVLSATGQSNLFLVKLDSSGTYQWGKSFACAATAIAGGIAFDSLDNPVICGGFTGNMNLGGGTITTLTTQDAFVSKYSKLDGSLSWTGSGGNPAIYHIGYTLALGLARDASGNIAVCGNFISGLDSNFSQGGVFIDSVSSTTAAQLWRYVNGPPGSGLYTPFMRGIVALPTGDIIGVGTMQDPMSFAGGFYLLGVDSDAMWFSLTSQGVCKWGVRANGSVSNHVKSDGQACCLDLDASGNWSGNFLVSGGGTIGVVPGRIVTTDNTLNTSWWLRVSP